MLNYWWVTRPKRKLDSIPEVLAAFADISLNQEWTGQRGTQIAYEEALEKAGLKRVGIRRDQSGSGGRTYKAWLHSLGLIFTQKQTKNIKLTLAGEAIINGDSPVTILKNQILKYQFPSSFSVLPNVQVHSRFKIRPFRFLLRLLSDSRLERYLTEEEIAKVVIVQAESETDDVYNSIVAKIIRFRELHDLSLPPDFFELYKPNRSNINPSHPFAHLLDIANTIVNWIEYTQLAIRNEDKKLVILDDKQDEVSQILANAPPFIDRPQDQEYFQRKYGLDPNHIKDTRNLEKTANITASMIAKKKIQMAYLRLSLAKPITAVTPALLAEIMEETGIADSSLVEEILRQAYPHGSIGAFMSSYFEMAFKGQEQCIKFELATAELFREVFKYNAQHLGQTGSKSAPDILLISDNGQYQAIIDNKAYSKYSISGDHHNRMVHNYIERIENYSQSPYSLGFFAYIAGGFGHSIDRQIKNEVRDSGVHGSCVTVAAFIKMIENHQNAIRCYSHKELREIFSLDRQITLADIQQYSGERLFRPSSLSLAADTVSEYKLENR
ncbi:MAG: restriction endonuclease FokI C-terminal domain-containing protein [bacterium]|nr:restriction endonuclease FokI C-terminal domain-containing protein [bacterium]